MRYRDRLGELTAALDRREKQLTDREATVQLREKELIARAPPTPKSAAAPVATPFSPLAGPTASASGGGGGASTAGIQIQLTPIPDLAAQQRAYQAQLAARAQTEASAKFDLQLQHAASAAAQAASAQHQQMLAYQQQQIQTAALEQSLLADKAAVANERQQLLAARTALDERWKSITVAITNREKVDLRLLCMCVCGVMSDRSVLCVIRMWCCVV